jgi:hypothetical protein
MQEHLRGEEDSEGRALDPLSSQVAFLPLDLIPKGEKYELGDEISGLKIYEVRADTKIVVTLRIFSSSYNVGDKVKGTVDSMHLRAVHFDIGMIRSATATRSTLSKDYVKDEEVELRITEINGDEVTVTDDLHQLAAGQRLTGTVTAVTEGYGVSFNIGGREAVCPPNQVGKPLHLYQEGETVEGLRIRDIYLIPTLLAMVFRGRGSEM